MPEFSGMFRDSEATKEADVKALEGAWGGFYMCATRSKETWACCNVPCPTMASLLRRWRHQNGCCEQSALDTVCCDADNYNIQYIYYK